MGNKQNKEEKPRFTIEELLIYGNIYKERNRRNVDGSYDYRSNISYLTNKYPKHWSDKCSIYESFLYDIKDIEQVLTKKEKKSKSLSTFFEDELRNAIDRKSYQITLDLVNEEYSEYIIGSDGWKKQINKDLFEQICKEYWKNIRIENNKGLYTIHHIADNNNTDKIQKLRKIQLKNLDLETLERSLTPKLLDIGYFDLEGFLNLINIGDVKKKYREIWSDIEICTIEENGKKHYRIYNPNVYNPPPPDYSNNFH